MLLWLNDVDAALSSSKPVGGLPETAKDQLDRFMEVFKELEATGPKVEALLGRGNDYLKKSKEGAANNLQNNLRVLKSRWDNILARANDKKIKLEIALKEATEFHDALQVKKFSIKVLFWLLIYVFYFNGNYVSFIQFAKLSINPRIRNRSCVA